MFAKSSKAYSGSVTGSPCGQGLIHAGEQPGGGSSGRFACGSADFNYALSTAGDVGGSFFGFEQGVAQCTGDELAVAGGRPTAFEDEKLVELGCVIRP